MKSHICKGQILMDMRDVRQELKKLEADVRSTSIKEGVSAECKELIQGVMGELGDSIHKCKEEADKTKSLVKLSDGKHVFMNDAELAEFEKKL